MKGKENKNSVFPGLPETIVAGFDVTTKHLWLLIIPVILDTFLWLGPRLSLRPLIEQFITYLPTEEAYAAFNEMLPILATRTNLFTSLSIPFIGVPVMLAGMTPENTPLTTTVVEMADPGLVLAYWLGLSFVGVLLTAVFLTLIAQTIQAEDQLTNRQLGHRTWQVWWRLLAGLMAYLMILLIIYILLVIIATAAALISPVLSLFVLLIGPFMGAWILISCYYTPHGLALYGRPLIRAIQGSLALMKKSTLPAVGLILVIILTNTFLDPLLQSLADGGSWLTFVSILGHAFINTSLITATFIFYRDKQNLLQNTPVISQS